MCFRKKRIKWLKIETAYTREKDLCGCYVIATCTTGQYLCPNKKSEN